MASWIGWWKNDAWTSDDGRTDYLAAMSGMKVPTLAMTSMGDGYLCTPAGAVRFITRAPAAQVTFELVRRADDGGRPPDLHATRDHPGGRIVVAPGRRVLRGYRLTSRSRESATE